MARPRIVAVNPAEGVYEITGSLDGVRLGDRVVRMLTVRRLGKEATVGLRPLAPLRDVRRLQLERITGGEWAILPPEGSVREWSTYGSLWGPMDAGDDETEYDAMKVAMAKLRAVDPRLLASLDFDHESDGTGITAPTREALESALRILRP